MPAKKKTQRVYVICEPNGKPSSLQMKVGGPLPVHPTKKRAMQYFPLGGTAFGWTIREAELSIGKPVRLPKKMLNEKPITNPKTGGAA